jgi:chromate transporter
MCGPPCALTYVAGAGWDRCSHLAWFRVLKAGLVPVTIGLLGASSWVVTSAAAEVPANYLVTAATAAVLLTTRTNPLLLLATAAGIGALWG